jgi:hypothetical protein
VQPEGREFCTPLQVAAQNGHADIVELLVTIWRISILALKVF